MRVDDMKVSQKQKTKEIYEHACDVNVIWRRRKGRAFQVGNQGEIRRTESKR